MMELPKLKTTKLEKYNNLKFNNNFPSRDGLLLKSLQNENIFIKKKLAEFESRLDMYPLAMSYDKFKSQSINVKNDPAEIPKPRKIKSARPVKRIDAFLSSQPPLIELKELDEEIKFDTPAQEFKIPEKSFSRLNSARLNSSRINSARINSSRVSSARPNSSRPNSAKPDALLMNRLKSAQINREPSARNISSNLSSRVNSAKTVETFSTIDESIRTNDSALDKMDRVLDNLKKHRRSGLRKQKVEENLQRPKTTNSVLRETPDKEIKPESAKKKSRSKSAKKSAKKDDYQHMFYSSSWRIHSEFMNEELDRKAPWDNTISLFYKTNRKLPETFIFSPDWI